MESRAVCHFKSVCIIQCTKDRIFGLVSVLFTSQAVNNVKMNKTYSISFENNLKSGVHDLRANFTMFITFLTKRFQDLVATFNSGDLSVSINICTYILAVGDIFLILC